VKKRGEELFFKLLHTGVKLTRKERRGKNRWMELPSSICLDDDDCPEELLSRER